jgi:hypothetical protein
MAVAPGVGEASEPRKSSEPDQSTEPRESGAAEHPDPAAEADEALGQAGALGDTEGLGQAGARGDTEALGEAGALGNTEGLGQADGLGQTKALGQTSGLGQVVGLDQTSTTKPISQTEPTSPYKAISPTEPTSPGEPMSPDERAELDRLRARLDERSRSRTAGRVGRWFASIVLLVLAAVIGIVAVVTGYVRGEVLNTDRYVATVAPLARDPAVRSAMTNRITDVIMTQLNVAGLTQQLITGLEQRGAPSALSGLAAPIENGVRSFVSSQTRTVVDSNQFATIWENVNRTAHRSVDAVLTGTKGEVLNTQGNTVYIDLGVLIAQVKQRMVANGFSLASKIPAVSLTYPIFQSDKLPTIRGGVKLLNATAWLLPLLFVVLLVGGVFTAPKRRRRRALLLGAFFLGVAMLVLLGVLAAVRSYYLGHLPPQVQSPDAAKVLYDTLLHFLVSSAQTLAVLALIAVIGLWLAGPGRVPVSIRRGLRRGAGALAGWLAQLGVRAGPVPGWLARYRSAIEVGAVLVALGVLIIWREPGIGGLLWATLAVLIVVGLVEMVMRLPARAAQLPGRAAQPPAVPG